MSNAILPHGHLKTFHPELLDAPLRRIFFGDVEPAVNQDYEAAKDLIREVASAQEETPSP